MKRSAQQNIFAPTFSLQDPMRYWTAKYFPPSCKVVIQRFVELLLVYISSINKHSFVIRWHFSPFSLRKVPSPFCIVIEKPEIEEEHPARIGSHDNSNEKRFTRNILHLMESHGPSPRVQSKKRAIFSAKSIPYKCKIVKTCSNPTDAQGGLCLWLKPCPPKRQILCLLKYFSLSIILLFPFQIFCC